MGLTEEQIGVKMRLMGATEYQAGMDKATESTVAYGNAAEKAGLQARDSAGKFTAAGKAAEDSSAVGIGAMKKMGTVGAGMKATGNKMVSGFTVPFALIAGASAKLAIDFNEKMALVQTQAGASAKELKYLTVGVKEFAASGKTGFTDEQLAESLYAIRSAGIKGSEALHTLRESSDFAEVGQANLAETTKALVSAQNSGIKGTENIHKAMGTLNATIGAGQMHMGELNSSIGTGFLGTAKALGLNLTEVGGALSFLTREGTPASAAATRLRMAFSLIANPTEKAVGALEGIGLTQSDLALKMRGPNGVVEAFKLLKTHLGEYFDLSSKAGKVGATQLLAEAFGGAKSGGTILQLIGNMEKLEQTTASVGNNTGKINADIVKAGETGEETFKHDWSQLNNSLIELGEAILPVLTPAIKGLATGITALVGVFVKLPSPVKNTITTMALLVATGGSVLIFLGKAAGAVSALGGVRLAGWAGSLVKTIIGVPGDLAGPFAEVRAFFYTQGALMGTVFDAALVVGIAAAAVGIGVLIYNHLSENTKQAIYNWGKNAGQNFVNALIAAVNWGIRAINNVLNEINALSVLGVHAPQLGEIGNVNLHGGVERQDQRAHKAVEHGMIEGPGGKLIPGGMLPPSKRHFDPRGRADFLTRGDLALFGGQRGEEAPVGPLRVKGGPTHTRPQNGRERGAYSRKPPRKLEVTVPVHIGRRQFGEAMAMAMIEDEENE